MLALRRALYLEAAVWAAVGLALAVAPRFVLVTLFDQPAGTSFAWVRLVGVQALGLAMLMVIVGHRVADLFWAAWAFALTTVGTAALALLNAAFGLGPDEPGALWWAFSAVAVAFALALLYGLFVASRENPLP